MSAIPSSSPHQRVQEAFAQIVQFERAAMRAAMDGLLDLAPTLGMREDVMFVFHSSPRDPSIMGVDEMEYSDEDASLVAVDVADGTGRRLRLTNTSLVHLAPNHVLAPPRELAMSLALPLDDPQYASPSSAPAANLLSQDDTENLWGDSVMAWVDVNRAMSRYAETLISSSFIVMPSMGDFISFDPLYCPDREQFPEGIISLKLTDSGPAHTDFDTELLSLLTPKDEDNIDQVGESLLTTLKTYGLNIPGFPAHTPGDCDFEDEDDDDEDED